MKQMIRMPEGELLERIETIILQTSEERLASVLELESRGVRISNDPTALMLTRPVPVVGNVPPGEGEQDVWVFTTERQLVCYRFTRGQGGYIDAWKAWPAYRPVCRLLEENGWSAEEIYVVVPRLFSTNHVYGVLTIVFHRFPDGKECILMGIRSKELAGTHVGDASFPGGLVRVDETIAQAAHRQMKDEGTCGDITMYSYGFAFDVHDAAPSMTFVGAARTTSNDVAPSYEWGGKRMLWIPRNIAITALEGDTAPLAGEFTRQGVKVDSLTVAGDAVKPARTILDMFPVP